MNMARAASAVSASRLLGAEVVGAQGEEVGAITDLAVDLRGEVVRYAIVYSNGSTVTRPMGRVTGEQVFGVPLAALRPGVQRDQLIYGSFPERKESQSDGAAAGAAGNDARMMRATTLLGLDVVTDDGRRAGDIVDFVLDLETGRVLHAVFRSDDPDSPRVEMPLSAFRFPLASGHAVLAAGIR